MDYTPEQIAAFVGAAAWAPQIGTWVYKLYRKPKVVIIPESRAELGYTTLGPIFNIRLAVSADLRDVLLDSFSIKVRHESGDTKTFRWQGTKETLNQVRDSSGILQTVERDEAGIALKVRPDQLVDKFFRFQDPQFAAVAGPLIEEVRTLHDFLLSKDVNVRDELMGSDKLKALMRTCRSNFNWRPGKYVAEFRCRPIHDVIRQEAAQFEFELTPQNIEKLQANSNLFEPYFEWHAFRESAENDAQEPVFHWVYPAISRR